MVCSPRVDTHLNRVGRGEFAVSDVDVDAQLSEAGGAVVVGDTRPEATKAFHHLKRVARESGGR